MLYGPNDLDECEGLINFIFFPHASINAYFFTLFSNLRFD